MNRPDSPKVVRLDTRRPQVVTIGDLERDIRERPFTPRLIRPAPDRLHREVADMDAWLNRRRPVHRRERLKRFIGTFALCLVGFLAIYFLFQWGRTFG